MAFSDTELVEKCVAELDRILLRYANIGEPISPYIGVGNTRIHRWMTDKNALDCVKLLAGESFSVDAGWTEPCLRTAIDTVINLCNNTGACFKGDFGLEHYPHYQVPRQAL